MEKFKALAPSDHVNAYATINCTPGVKPHEEHACWPDKMIGPVSIP